MKQRFDYQVSLPILLFHTCLGQVKVLLQRRRAKRLKVCHRFARWTCNAKCRSLGMISINREEKIQFIKDDLSKESLDNLLLTLETHPSGDVHRAIHDLWHNSIKNMLDIVLGI